jgi:protein CWC15
MEQLMKEYERIKQMREKEKQQKELLEKEKLKEKTQEKILLGNPLLNSKYSLKKKWFEDTVFKNQSKTEPKTKVRHVNDTVRSDFHRKFMSKYVQ